MNSEELTRSSLMLTSELRRVFGDTFLRMPAMNEQERFFLVMNSISAFSASMIDALINDQYPDKKMEILEEYCQTCKALMKHKIKLEKEIISAESH